LREGLNQLWQHVTIKIRTNLKKAYDRIPSRPNERVDFYEAYLYEGIALDLLSQHDEAIKRFEYLKTKSAFGTAAFVRSNLQQSHFALSQVSTCRNEGSARSHLND